MLLIQISFIHPAAPTILLAGATSYLIRYVSGKSFLSNAITNNFIYQFLLPLIVLTEGFNMRKKSLNVYGKEVTYFGIIVPFFTCIFNALILVFTQQYIYEWTDLIPVAKKLRNDVLISIAITMSTVELHGSVAPLHSVSNMKLYKILFSSATFNNNISLILVMTFERMIHAGGASI